MKLRRSSLSNENYKYVIGFHVYMDVIAITKPIWFKCGRFIECNCGCRGMVGGYKRAIMIFTVCDKLYRILNYISDYIFS